MSHTHDDFKVPAGTQAVQVRIIDSTSRIGKIPVHYIMTPPVEGMDYMPLLPSWSFLVEHPSGKKVLFDLGVPKDWLAFAPTVSDTLRTRGWDISVEKEVIDVLQANGIESSEINAIIWRYGRQKMSRDVLQRIADARI